MRGLTDRDTTEEARSRMLALGPRCGCCGHERNAHSAFGRCYLCRCVYGDVRREDLPKCCATGRPVI